ncbi:MAG: TAXI family TRAP transporter solute-binding subunit [Planctomycetaceae bacterium]|nr:MAG: TAXI family TRAP transporter solute-binding subunit [Planctomycetaceae bacterium]
MRFAHLICLTLSLSALAWLPFAGGCGGGQREFISLGTAPVGGVFYTVGSAISEVVNEHRGESNWRVSAESTGGSMENIRLLTQGKLQFAMSNSSITYFAVRGEGDWEQAHDVRAVMTLFPNVANFVTQADSGIESIADLRGKRVFLGPEGAGFEYFVNPILAAHGMSIADLEPRYGSQQSAVDLLGDGAVVAAMIGGGVPNPALSQMAQANPIRMVPYDEAAKEKLIADYPFFEAAMIPGGTYAGLDEDFQGLNVGSAHLITHADTDEQLVYEFTKKIFENREQIASRHRAAKDIRAETVSVANGTEFHPGALRFYAEMGADSTTVDHD